MSSGARYDFSRVKLLVLDDNKFMRSVLDAMFRALGVGDVQMVDSFEAACTEMRTFAADIVIADWHMGPPDGLDFVRFLRHDPASPNPYVPIIMLTGHGDREHVLAARDAGVNSFIAKPVSAKGLYQRLAWIIDNPSPFIRTDDYFGPNRRFKDDGPPVGIAERRKDLLEL